MTPGDEIKNPREWVWMVMRFWVMAEVLSQVPKFSTNKEWVKNSSNEGKKWHSYIKRKNNYLNEVQGNKGTDRTS